MSRKTCDCQRASMQPTSSFMKFKRSPSGSGQILICVVIDLSWMYPVVVVGMVLVQTSTSPIVLSQMNYIDAKKSPFSCYIVHK